MAATAFNCHPALLADVRLETEVQRARVKEPIRKGGVGGGWERGWGDVWVVYYFYLIDCCTPEFTGHVAMTKALMVVIESIT